LLKLCTAIFGKNLIITLAFEKNANFFAENWQKSQKIVIITSTPAFVNLKNDTQSKQNPPNLVTLVDTQIPGAIIEVDNLSFSAQFSDQREISSQQERAFLCVVFTS
jgi:hypothetical protein